MKFWFQIVSLFERWIQPLSFHIFMTLTQYLGEDKVPRDCPWILKVKIIAYGLRISFHATILGPLDLQPLEHEMLQFPLVASRTLLTLIWMFLHTCGKFETSNECFSIKKYEVQLETWCFFGVITFYMLRIGNRRFLTHIPL